MNKLDVLEVVTFYKKINQVEFILIGTGKLKQKLIIPRFQILIIKLTRVS